MQDVFPHLFLNLVFGCLFKIILVTLTVHFDISCKARNGQYSVLLGHSPDEFGLPSWADCSRQILNNWLSLKKCWILEALNSRPPLRKEPCMAIVPIRASQLFWGIRMFPPNSKISISVAGRCIQGEGFLWPCFLPRSCRKKSPIWKSSSFPKKKSGPIGRSFIFWGKD